MIRAAADAFAWNLYTSGSWILCFLCCILVFSTGYSFSLLKCDMNMMNDKLMKIVMSTAKGEELMNNSDKHAIS